VKRVLTTLCGAVVVVVVGGGGGGGGARGVNEQSERSLTTAAMHSMPLPPYTRCVCTANAAPCAVQIVVL